MPSTNNVDSFMTDLDHPLKEEIQTLRALMLGTDSRIHETVKWNAPNFILHDDFATFQLRSRTQVQVVLHCGAKKPVTPKSMNIHDPAGLLKWAAPDRCIATFTTMDSIRQHEAAFVAIVQQWIAQL